jgi:hypothetical protein
MGIGHRVLRVTVLFCLLSAGCGGHALEVGFTDAGAAGTSDDDSAAGGASDAGPFSAGSCGFSTCPDGCCLGDGGCFVVGLVATDGSIPCGLYGERCQTCLAGYSCGAGGCLKDLWPDSEALPPPENVCGPSNCPGCCFAEGTNGSSTQCFEGTQDEFCGTGGVGCARCAPPTNGGHCVANPTAGGHCEGAGQCNATSCAGCCAGGLCVAGSQDVGCGSNGTRCQDCTADGGICIGYGANPTVTNPSDLVTNFECGYGCLPTGFGCTSYCTGPSDCSSMPGP